MKKNNHDPVTLERMTLDVCRRLALPDRGIAFSVIRSALRDAALTQRRIAAAVVVGHPAKSFEQPELYAISLAVLAATIPEE